MAVHFLRKHHTYALWCTAVSLVAVVWVTNRLFSLDVAIFQFSSGWVAAFLSFTLFSVILLSLTALRHYMCSTVNGLSSSTKVFFGMLFVLYGAASALLLSLFPYFGRSSHMESTSYDALSVLCGPITGMISFGMFVWKEEYILSFAIIHKSSYFQIRTKVFTAVIESSTRALVTLVVSVLMHVVLRREWTLLTMSIWTYYDFLHALLALFLLCTMLHFYLMLSEDVLQVFLTRPLRLEEGNVSLEDQLMLLTMHDEGTLESLFVGYSEGTDGTNAYIQSEEHSNFLHRRFKYAMDKIVHHDDDSMAVFRREPLAIDHQLACSLGFLRLNMVARFSYGHRMELYEVDNAWEETFRRCTAPIDALTFTLSLSSSCSDNRTTSGGSMEISTSAESTVEESVSKFLLTLRNTRNANPVVMDYVLSKRAANHDKTEGKTMSMSEGGKCTPQPVQVPVIIFRRVVMYTLRKLAKLYRSVAMSPLYVSIQVVLWSIESLSMLTASAMKEDKRGIVQQTVPAVVESLLACKLAVESYKDAQTYVKSCEVLTASQSKTLEYVLDRAIYRIVTAAYDQVEDYRFSPEYASKLQEYVDFKA